MPCATLLISTLDMAGVPPPDPFRDPGFVGALNAALRPAIMVRSDDPDLPWFLHATGGAPVIVIDAGDPSPGLAAAIHVAAANWLRRAGYNSTVEVRPA
jgi:hypothetical protein